MYSLERQKEILELLQVHKTLQVEKLCNLLYVSPSTIRRDLNRMEKNGLLTRTHGGAMLLEGSAYENPFLFREQKYQVEKNRICALAASQIIAGQTIFLDTSSTVTYLVPYLTRVSSLTVITNNMKVAELLSSNPNCTTILAGGRVRPNSFSVLGVQAKNFFEQYYADIAFLSCNSFSATLGMTESHEEEAELKRALLGNAKRTVLLCDHSKIGKTAFCKVCDASGLSAIVTDTPLPTQDAALLAEKGVEILVVEKV